MKNILRLFLLFLLLSACKTGKNAETSKPVHNPAYINAFHEATRLKVRGQVDEAISGFEACLLIRQDDDAVYYALSQLYLIKNDKVKSAENIQKAAKIDETNIWYTQELAYMYFESGNYPEAIKYFEKLNKHEPNNVEWLYGYGESLVRGDKILEAIKIYNKMEDQVGKHPELSIQKFKLYIKLKDEAKAIAEIESCRKEYPNDSQLIATLVDYYFQKGKEAEAIVMLEELVKADPMNGRAHLALADVYRQKGDQKRAYGELKMAFSCDDVTLDNKMQILITILDNSFKIDPEAFELVEMVVAAHPEEAKAHSIRGDYMLKEGKDSEALLSYKNAIKFDKKIFPIWNQVLVMEYQANMFYDLYIDSKECLEYFTTMPTVYLLNGVGAVKMKKYDEALTTLESGIELVTNDKGVEAEFNAQMAEAHFGLKDLDKGVLHYEKAIQLDPKSTLIKNNYAYRLAIFKKDLDRAEELIDEVLKVAGEVPHYLDTKAFVLFMKGKYQDAKPYSEKAYNLKPSDAISVEHYGDILFMLGDKTKGVELWKKAKELGSGNKNLDKKIEKKEYYDPIY
jgi:tetratricopeptide (TPR) repeat protein